MRGRPHIRPRKKAQINPWPAWAEDALRDLATTPKPVHPSLIRTPRNIGINEYEGEARPIKPSPMQGETKRKR